MHRKIYVGLYLWSGDRNKGRLEKVHKRNGEEHNQYQENVTQWCVFLCVVMSQQLASLSFVIEMINGEAFFLLFSNSWWLFYLLPLIYARPGSQIELGFGNIPGVIPCWYWDYFSSLGLWSHSQILFIFGGFIFIIGETSATSTTKVI